MNNTNEWIGLTSFDIITKVTQYVKPVLQAAKQGKQDEMEASYDIMLEKLNEVKHIVAEEKTYQWQFRNYNEHYTNWENCLNYINKFLDIFFQDTLMKLLESSELVA